MPSNPDLIRRLLDGTASTEERAQLLLDLGELRRQQGLPARPLLEAAASVLPMAASAPLGMLSLVEGAPADAARWFAVAQDVDDPADQAQAIANGATAAFAQGDVAGAEAGFRRAMAVRVGAGLTQDPLLHINLGRCLADLGELDAGLRHLDAAASLAGSLTRPAALADMLAGELAWQHHRTGAASLLRRALSGPLTPIEQARCQVPLADLLQHEGDIDGAIALLQVASAALPPGRDRASALTTLGGCLYLRRALAPAAAALEAAHNELPADSHGTPLHTRLRINRALSLIAQDSLEQALPELTAACEDLRQRDQREALARQLRSLSDLHRYMGDLDAAIAVQGELVTLEATLDGPLPEGGMLYTPVEDRGLNLSLAQISRAGPQVGTGPVLFLVPPAWGARGPLFPRGAASVASFLVAEGIPAEVLPLADHVLPSDDASTVAQKTRSAVQHAIDALRPRASRCILFKSTDTVLEAGLPRYRPRTGEGLGFTQVRKERPILLGVGGIWSGDVRQVVEIRQRPWFGRRRDVTIGQQDHRGHELDGDALSPQMLLRMHPMATMSTRSAAVTHRGDRTSRRAGQIARPLWAVRLKVHLAGCQPQPSGVRSSTQAKGSRTSVRARVTGGGHSQSSCECCPECGSDTGDLVLCLERLDTEVLVTSELFKNRGGRCDGV